LATRLRVLRLARGESLSEVLERLGNVNGTVSESLAYNVEVGRRKAPKSWREPWAAALGIESSKLFDAEGWPVVS
jgi:transcriptional regulator with XRE-family HTH domain